MNKQKYQIIIGDNSFSIDLDDNMFNILKSTLSNNVKIMNKEDKKEFEFNNAKINAQSVYSSFTDAGWSLEGKLKFINEFIELVIKEKN